MAVNYKKLSHISFRATLEYNSSTKGRDGYDEIRTI